MKSICSRTFATWVIAAGLAAAGPVLADDSVDARLRAAGINFEVDGDGDYKVTYSYSKEGRTQLVFVSGGTQQVAGFTVREVFSPAARLAKDGITGGKALELLAESRKNKLGSWEVAGDVLYFVIKFPDDLDAGELEMMMDIAAETADDMELEISGDRDDL
jgi:hypothetical protein